MTPTDRQFTKELGGRLAQLRQETGLTQQVVAAHLGVAQQTLAHYEVA
jgi:transcriptional regulator with XRE-family HTH domain